MAQSANTSATRVSYIAEVTPGVIPATPAWKRLRVTGEDFEITRETDTSEELDPSRNVKDAVNSSGGTTGGAKFEFSDDSFEDIIEFGTGGAWTDDVLTNGVAEKSMAVECTYEAGATDVFKRLTGQYVNEFSLQVAPKQKVMGSFACMGLGGAYASAIVAGATYLAAGTDRPMSSSLDFGTLAFTGLTVDCITSLSMKWANNLEPKYCLNGSIDPDSIGFGDFICNGELELFLSSDKLPFLQAALDNTATGISFVLGKTTLKKTKIEMPSVRLMKPKVAVESKNGAVRIKCSYQAFGSSTIGGSTVRVTRNLV